jgi:hypothetical protein
MGNPYEGDSTDNKVPGIRGVNLKGGTGVWGESDNQGGGPTWIGVYGKSSSTIGGAGVYGENSAGPGVTGVSHGNGNGVYGESQQFEGVRGVSHAAWHGGVVGVNDNANTDPNNPAGPGVYGNSKGTGVSGESTQNGPGVVGKSVGGIGVFGESQQGAGVQAVSQNGEAIHGETNSLTTGAVAGISLNPNGTGAGVYGESRGKGPAGFFMRDNYSFGNEYLEISITMDTITYASVAVLPWRVAQKVRGSDPQTLLLDLKGSSVFGCALFGWLSCHGAD